MTRLFAAAILSAVVALPMTASAESSGGDRQAAGGAHMSTYIAHPSHDPHSVWSQRNRTGQLLGAPMRHEMAPAIARRDVVHPHWATGTAPSRRVR